MTTQNISDKDRLIEVLKTENALSSKDMRKVAIDFINQNDFPSIKTETWKHTDIGKLLKHQYKKAEKINISAHSIKIYSVLSLDAYKLVFVNGYFSKTFSELPANTTGIIVENMESVKRNFPEIFDRYHNKISGDYTNVFEAMNTAYAEDGVFIYIPRNCVLDKPVHILNFSDGNQLKTISQIRNVFVAEENAQVNIIQSYHSLSVNYTITNIFTEILVNQHAIINYYVFQGEGDDAAQINCTKVVQKSNSSFDYSCFTLCGSLVRNGIDVKLLGEFCESNLYGLYMPDREQHFDNYVSVNHEKPNCVSNQLFKGIVDNRAHAVFFGRIYVAKDAQKTNAYQTNRNILLTDYAKANSKPQLEIYADDVKCSHGSTTGQLDEDALFYMQSRGIGKKVAKILLLNAYAEEVTDRIKIPELKSYIEFLIERRMSGEKINGQCAMIHDCKGC